MERHTTDTPPGRLYDVGGHRLHLDCRGESNGQPTVILEAGAAEFSATWGLVQDELASHTRVCSYDRSGLGWSDVSNPDHSPARVARELHALLEVAHVRPPYIMVGHSLGGVYVQAFASIYPAEVEGMVLVDPAHEEQFERLQGKLSRRFGLPKGRPMLIRFSRLLVALGIFRQRQKRILKKIPDPLRPVYRKIMLAKKHLRSSVDDSFLIEDYLRQAKESEFNFGDLPLIVIGAGKSELPRQFTPADRELLARSRQEMLGELARRSTRGRYIEAPESGHMVQWDQPQVVVENILPLLR